MAAKNINFYCCELCGEDGLSEKDMRDHMISVHVEGAISCPFCDLGDITPEEMMEHVSAVHLNEKEFSNVNDNENLNSVGVSGSPMKSQLSLNLNNCSPKWRRSQNSFEEKKQNVIFCPICSFQETNATRLQEHVNRQHFDLTSPSFPDLLSPDKKTQSAFNCPLCSKAFVSSDDLEMHVNIDHRDILSPSKATEMTPSDENCNESCPICGRQNFQNAMEMTLHIEEHFDKRNSGAITPCTPSFEAKQPQDGEGASPDHLLALEIERKEREEQRLREQHEFQILQAQYGMDNQGNFKEQSLTNMQRAVYSGEMSVSDYYNRQVELRNAERSGVDDGHSCTKGLLPKIRIFSSSSLSVEKTYLCSAVNHFGSTYGDKGWGCGYRNIQMVLSSFFHHTSYYQRFFNGNNTMPSISKLQELIEAAWRKGFDPQGCEQLGGRLTNTRKWIGATEVMTLLSSFRIRCSLVDCHQPTGPGGTHPEMFYWVKEYFRKDCDFRAPIYLQHHGHSRSIIGVEELKDGSIQLLVFDPSHSKAQLDQFNNTTAYNSAMKLLRRPITALKAHQYQIVAVIGLLENEDEYNMAKVLRSIRIPMDS